MGVELFGFSKNLWIAGNSNPPADKGRQDYGAKINVFFLLYSMFLALF